MSALPRRLLTREEVRDYLGGVSDSTLARWIREGVIPGPVPGKTRWDVKALDRALDRASGLLNPAIPPEGADPYLAGLDGEGRA